MPYLKRLSLLDITALVTCVLAIALLWQANPTRHTGQELLHASTPSTAELFADLNRRFAAGELATTGVKVHITQAHAGNHALTTAILARTQQPDVVSMSLPSSVDQFRSIELVAADWKTRPPGGMGAWYTTVVFVVRAGNPWRIKDWPDLVKIGVGLMLPDPARTTLGQTVALAAWGAVRVGGGDPDDAEAFLRRIYQHTLYRVDDLRVLHRLFVEEQQGDALLLREHDALALVKAHPETFDIVYPPVSLLAESGVTWLDSYTSAHGTTPLAMRYLNFMFTAEAQQIMATHGFRPISDKVFAANRARFPHVEMFPITAVANSWLEAMQTFFGPSGIIDTLYANEVREVFPAPALDAEAGGYNPSLKLTNAP